MNVEENQEFKSSDVIMLSALITAIFAIATVVLARNVGDKDVDRAKYHAARLTQQLLSSGLNPVSFDQENSSKTRNPASAKNIEYLGYMGRISKDPWGEPYHYKVFHQDTTLLGVAVWSGGPNKVSDTEDKDLALHAGDLVYGVFRGDDLGAIESIAK